MHPGWLRVCMCNIVFCIKLIFVVGTINYLISHIIHTLMHLFDMVHENIGRAKSCWKVSWKWNCLLCKIKHLIVGITHLYACTNNIQWNCSYCMMTRRSHQLNIARYFEFRKCNDHTHHFICTSKKVQRLPKIIQWIFHLPLS